MAEFNTAKLDNTIRAAKALEEEYSKLNRNPWPGGIKRKYRAGKIYKGGGHHSENKGKPRHRGPAQPCKHTHKVLLLKANGKKRFVTVGKDK